MRKLRQFLFTVFLLCLTVASRSAETLPRQLSDDAFWKFIEASAEPTQPFPGENLVSNEPRYAAAVHALRQEVTPGGVFIGVGPEQNFSYIAALKPQAAFIVDIRRQNLVELIMYKVMFELAEDRADFLSRLFSRRRPDGLNSASTVESLMNAYAAAPPAPEFSSENLSAIRTTLKKHAFVLTTEDDATLERIVKAFAESGTETNYQSGGSSGSGRPAASSPAYATLMKAVDLDGNGVSYLATEESYRIVRDLQLRNLIIPVVGDFAGPKAIRSIGSFLSNYDAFVRVFYVSNVETYLFAGSGPGAPTEAVRRLAPNAGWQRFFENVSALPLDARSTFIRFQGAAANGELASIQKNLADVKNGTIRTYLDLFAR